MIDITRCCLVLCLVLASAIPAAAADDARPAPVALPIEADPDDRHDLLFLASGRPVFLRVQLRRDGRSSRAEWRDFAARTFRELDFNGDGLLTGDEWGGVPGRDQLVNGYVRGVRGDRSGAEAMDVAPWDGQITFEEFLEYLTLRGAPPLAVQALGSPAVTTRGTPGAANAAGSQLFSRLDSDHDRRLSPAEFEAGPAALARIDFDDDGAIAASELQVNTVADPLADEEDAQPQPLKRPSQFIDLAPSVGRESIARLLLDQYDSKPPARPRRGGAQPPAVGDDRLTRQEFPLAGEAFTKLDVDGNDELDFTELQQIGRDWHPAIELLVRIGRRDAGQPAVEVLRIDPVLQASVRPLETGALAILAAGEQIEIAAEAEGTASRFREQMQQQFKQVDDDNNNYLERKEVRGTAFNQLFDAMDDDGDGKLFEREMLEYVGRREAAAASRCLLTVIDEGRNLFEILDANGDGRLSPRELRSAAAHIAAWDADKDGKLSEKEIPTHFRLTFGGAQPNIPGFAATVDRRVAPRGAVRASARSAGPAWFQRMDKNGDGDISRREFLGTKAAFDRLDKNGDGLIDAAEADEKKE